jgi:hypothetical protein
MPSGWQAVGPAARADKGDAVRRRVLAVALVVGALSLSACHRNDEAPEAQPTDVPQSVIGNLRAVAAVENQYATPVKDRVATIGLLNKRNNEVQDVVLKSGEARRIGNVVVKLATCEKSLPWERPPEVGAFVQLFVEERASIHDSLAWRKVFSGWLFKNAPSLNVVEHPVYDVWVKDCAMKFPGEEENPEDAAAFAKASKAQSSDSAPDTAPVAPPSGPSEADAGEADSAN